MPSPFHHPTPPDPGFPQPVATYNAEEDAEYNAWHTYAPLALKERMVVTVCPNNPEDPFWHWTYGVYLLRPSPRSPRATRDALPY